MLTYSNTILSTDEIYVDLLQDIFYSIPSEKIKTRNSYVKRLFNIGVTFYSTPLVSVRKTPWKLSLREWEWFMSGSTNIKHLHPSVQHWWKPWANEINGEIYFNYSKQFRDFSSEFSNIDSIDFLKQGIINHPFSRRNVITTWNTAEMNSSLCPITNCHGTIIQCFVDSYNKLHLTTYQRSADVICGLPSNWIQYWAFLLWLAYHTGREVGSFTWIGGDVHIYEAHEQLATKIMEAIKDVKETPHLIYDCRNSADDVFKADDFRLDGLYLPIVIEKAEMVI